MISRAFHDNLAIITLERDGARNALSISGWEALAEVADEIGVSDARAVVLRSGMPGVFSAGADLKEFRQLVSNPAMRTRFRLAMAAGIEAIAALPMPVIAAVDGGCFGAAVAVTLACDIVVAGDDAVFATTPAKLGIGYPANDVARLKARVGAAQASLMLLSGTQIRADEAVRIGLAQRRATDAEAAAMELAKAIAANAPDAVRLLKRMLRDPAAAGHDAAFEDAFGSPAFAARLEAFFGRGAMTRRIAGGGDVLILCDHASNAVPDDIDLGIDPALLDKHIAIDIGAGAVSEALAVHLGATALLATISRLVIDLNREVDSPGLIPTISDGHDIPGNKGADRTRRIAQFHTPYHATITAEVRANRPKLLVSVHSFTPRLESAPGPERPWELGILYNRDARGAGIVIELLRARGVVTGDNEPYSGRVLNATMNRHAEANGIPYIGIEIRNDLIGDPSGVAHWAEIIADIVSKVRDHLASQGPGAT